MTPTLSDLADRLDIELVYFDPEVPDSAHARASRSMRGPVGGGIDIANRMVYVEEGMQDEHILHEMVHVYIAVPWGDGVTDICESWLLFAVEDLFARWLGIDQALGYRTYQRSTMVQVGGGHDGVDYYDDACRLKDLDPLVRHVVMSRAWSLADRLGMIDPLGFATFHRPNWLNLAIGDLDLMNAPQWQVDDGIAWINSFGPTHGAMRIAA